LTTIEKKYAGKGVRIFLLDASIDSNRDRSEILRKARTFGTRIPILFDDHQSVARAVGFTMSAQAAVILPMSGEVIYRGAIDDAMNFDGRRVATAHYLESAFASVLKGQTPDPQETRAFGCALKFEK
jgi:hypothetical protein